MLSGDWETRRDLINRVGNQRIDHLFMADHVSFINGAGMDAMVNAATLAAMHPSLKICLGVYLLALRHPVPVARQLSTLSLSAPGRIILGVGVGGEDRHEMKVCGIDPRTRGRRTNECLEIIRELATGKPLDYSGEFFELENALIKPAVNPGIPIMVGGRANAAIRRAGLFSEGWLGVWCSANRFKAAIEETEEIANQAGRADVPWRHGLQIWVGIDDDKQKARNYIASEMQAFYKLPFEAFEKYSPYGTPEEVAEFLAAYQANGCQIFNVKACAKDEQTAIDAVATIREKLVKG
jgi:alkanesulfonate monooxygenase SsuD/methylene tetrahydromethanopterin reductase-like flavin-dependent oxidoreductase (luciferase family)